MNRPGQRPGKKIRSRKPPNERLIRTLTACCSRPAELLELYYWCKEPGLIDVVRGIATMPEETRAALEAFIALAREAKSISADLDQRGVLTLSSAEAARTVALAQYAAEDDADDPPRLLN